MTELVRVQRTIRGEEDHVRNAIATARRAGRLVRVTEARRLTTGQVEAVAYMWEVRDTRPWFRRRPRLAATMVGLFLAAFAGLAYLVGLFVEWVIRNFATIAFVAVLAAALLLSATHKVTKAAGCCPCHRR